MRMWLRCWTVMLLMLFGSAAAQACSMRQPYRTPTNFELLEQADLVVLARLQPAVAARSPDPVGTITLRPVRVLKGELPPQPLTIYGGSEWNGHDIPSLPTSFRQSHFSAGMGACVRIFYPREGLVLAMFTRTAAGWQPMFAAFARTAEDVESEDGFWVRAATEYLAFQAHTPAAARRAAVRTWVDELDRRSPDALSQAMAADLRYYLSVSSGASGGRPALTWFMASSPWEALATIGNDSGEHTPRPALLCRAGSASLRIMAPQTAAGRPLRLTIGDRTFEAVARPDRNADGSALVSGEVPLTDDLFAALTGPARAAALIAGDLRFEAPPAEVLPLMAQHCRRLRTQMPPPAHPV